LAQTYRWRNSRHFAFLLPNDAAVKELYEVIGGIEERTGLVPIVLASRKGKLGRDAFNALKPFRVVNLPGLWARVHSPVAKSRFWAIVPNAVANTLQFLFDLKGKETVADRLVDKYNVAGIAVVGDRSVGWETAFLKVARQRRCPSILLPFAYSHPLANYEYRRKKHEYERSYRVNDWQAYVVARFFPECVRRFGAEKVLFFPSYKILAAFLARQLPSTPWFPGADVNVLAAQSEFHAEVAQREGIPDEKIVVTGQASNDKYSDAAREHDQEQIPRETVFLYSVHQAAEIGLIPWREHLVNTNKLLVILASLADRVIINFHPRCEKEKYKDAIPADCTEVSSSDIYKDIIDCDLFIAGPSSTVFFALALGKPVVVTNFYHGQESFIPDDALINSVSDFDQLHDAIRNFMNEETSTAHDGRDPRYWGVVDGRSTQRILDTVKRLVNDHRRDKPFTRDVGIEQGMKQKSGRTNA